MPTTRRTDKTESFAKWENENRCGVVDLCKFLRMPPEVQEDYLRMEMESPSELLMWILEYRERLHRRETLDLLLDAFDRKLESMMEDRKGAGYGQ